jgi:hypothetical protein
LYRSAVEAKVERTAPAVPQRVEKPTATVAPAAPSPAPADRKGRTPERIASLKKTSEAISSADLKMKTDARIANISQQLSEIDGCAAQVDTIAGELSKDFSDLRSFLRADLSTRGLADAAPMAKGIDGTINRLGKAVDELKRQLSDVEAAIASGA